MKSHKSQVTSQERIVVRAVLLFLFSFFFFPCVAQQTPQYTQFMLNNYGLNPAACGNSNNRIEALTGYRRQWIGFDNPPTTTFFNVTTYFGRKGGGFNHGWHGIGAYWQGDKMGEMIKTDDFYASYTYNMRLMRTGYIAFGLAVGARRYGFRITEPTDPILNAKNIWLYPDFIPGVKFYNSKWSFDLSVKQLYKNKVKQGGDAVGSSAWLYPHVYFSVSQKWWARPSLLIIQSVHIKSDLASFPSIDYNALTYLNKYFAVGLSYRHFDAIAAIVQFRYEKLVIGIAYDYTIAPYRIGFANTQEFMLGLSPSPWDDGGNQSKFRTAECPAFQY